MSARLAKQKATFAATVIAQSGLQVSGGKSEFGGSLAAASGIDSSAVVQAPSALLVSGLNLSATVKGTIGDFVASVLAASGLNASAKVGGTIGEFLATVLAGSGLNSSGPVEAPSIVVVSVVNVSGPEAARSLIAASNLQVSNGPAQLASTLEVSGATSIGGALNVYGDATVSGVVAAKSTLSVSGGLTVSGPVNAKSTLEVSGALTVSGAVTATSTLESSGVASIGGNLNAYANATVSGTLAAKSTLSVSGALTVSGAVTLASTLEVSGAVSIGGAVGIKGTTSILATIVASNTVVLKVSGAFFIQNSAGTPKMVWHLSPLTNALECTPAASIIFDTGGGGATVIRRDFYVSGSTSIIEGSIFAQSGIQTSARSDFNATLFVGSAFMPFSAAVASTGNPNIGGAAASQKFGTIFAASTTIGDIGFTDELCDICKLSFHVGETVGIYLKGVREDVGGDGKKYYSMGGPPVHMHHLLEKIVATMVKSAMSQPHGE